MTDRDYWEEKKAGIQGADLNGGRGFMDRRPKHGVARRD